MNAVHQVVSSLRAGDAVGHHALEAQRLLRDLGFESRLFAMECDDVLADRCEPLAAIPRGGRGAALVYQMAVGSPAADAYARFSGKKVLNYHNLTPAEFFRVWDPAAARGVEDGRRQLRDLAAVTDLAIAVSAFNGAELEAAGYRRVVVSPPLVDLEALASAPDDVAARRLRDQRRAGGADVLFVGRVVPHKAQHDLVQAFAVYRALHDPRARLRIVGGEGPPAYVDRLRRLVEGAGLSDAVDIPGSVSPGELAAYYSEADVFVCLSEHEGFCIPLLEAFAHDVPVIAYRAAAVPETLADAGIVLDDKDASTVAAAIHAVLGRPGLRDDLVAAGRRRLDFFSLPRSRARFAAVVREITGVAASAGEVTP